MSLRYLLKILFFFLLIVLAGIPAPQHSQVVSKSETSVFTCDIFEDESKHMVLGPWLEYYWVNLTTGIDKETFRYCILRMGNSYYGGTILNRIARLYASKAFSIELIVKIIHYFKDEGYEAFIKVTDKDKNIPLHSAINSMAEPECVRIFANTSEYTKDCLTAKNSKELVPLELAFELEHFKAAEVLLELSIQYKVLPRLTGFNTSSSTTLLHKAFKRGHVEYFEILLSTVTKLGVKLLPILLVPDEVGNTPWQYLIDRNQKYSELEKVLSLCKEYNINIDELYLDPQRQSTMLHAAIRKNDKKATKILQTYGATELPDSRGIKPFQRNHCPYCNSSMDDIKEMHKIEDVKDLIVMLEDIGNWEGLCINLGVPSGIIDELRYSRLEVSVLKIRCAEAYIDLGNAMWEGVIWAVKLYPIQNMKTAKKIEQKYLQQ